MTKTFPALCLIALLAVSCTTGVSRIQSRPLPRQNPTSWSFPLPVEDVRTKAMEAFSIHHQVQEPVFGHSAVGSGFEDIFSAESSTNAVFGKDVFSDPANANDIYLHTFGTAFAVSPVYYGRDGGLPFIATFHLHLTGTPTNTLVAVTASDTEVVNGRKFGFGPCGPGYAGNCKPVKPTTVEEYSLLRYLGHYLGVTNMPDTILPAQ